MLGKNSSLQFKQTAVTATDAVDLLEESLVNERLMYDGDADSLIGGRQQGIETVNAAGVMAEMPGGSFKFRPRYKDLEKAFLYALGGATVSDSGPTAFEVEVDRAGAQVEKFHNCYIDQLVWESEKKGSATVQLDVIAKTSEKAASLTASPTYTNVIGVAPVKHSALVITGTTGISGLTPEKFSFTLKNNLQDDEFANSDSRLSVPAEQFECEVSMDVDVTEALATHINTWYTNKTILELIATYSTGGLSAAFTFNVISTTQLPNVNGTGIQKVTLTFVGKAVKSGTPEDMFQYSIDSTP